MASVTSFQCRLGSTPLPIRTAAPLIHVSSTAAQSNSGACSFLTATARWDVLKSTVRIQSANCGSLGREVSPLVGSERWRGKRLGLDVPLKGEISSRGRKLPSARPSLSLHGSERASGRRTLVAVTASSLVAAAAASDGSVAEGKSDLSSGYALPPAEILSIVDAPPNPSLSFSPKRDRVLFMHRPALPPIAELARPELKLAGVRIDPDAHTQSRMSFYTGVTIHTVNSDDTLGESVEIHGMPAGSKLNFLSWSPDGRHLAFTVRGEGGEPPSPPRHLSLWVADASTGHARHLLASHADKVNGVFETYSWLDSNTLLACIIPTNHAAPPQRPPVPPGPSIQDNQSGAVNQSRTFTDLLRDEHDGALLQHYATSQLVTVRLDDPEGQLTTIGQPDMFLSVEPSPNGEFLLVERLRRPFSLAVPLGRFPRCVEVWRAKTGEVMQTVADLPLADNIPVTFNSVRSGRRSINWRPDLPAHLYWVETQDGGDASVCVSPRDIVFTAAADAKQGEEPKVVHKLELRYGGITWCDSGLALVYESWFKTRRTRTWAVAPGGADGPLPPPDQRPAPKLVFDRSYEDRYSDPGSPLLRRTELGTYVLAQVRVPGGGLRLVLSGNGATPEGNIPFLDLLDLESGSTDRIWRSDSEQYLESVSSLLSDQSEGPMDLCDLKLLLSREAKDQPPQIFVKRFSDGSEQQLTRFPHPYPSLRLLSKEIIRYQRADGVPLTATLFLPPGYEPMRDGPLPVLLWAYPREYKSREAAGQMSGSKNQFTGIGATSPLLHLARGYAVLSGPSMPIIGEGEEEANDSFVHQLVSSAQAAVDELVRRGVSDGSRLAIGGHSYGAFMAGNLLSHAPHMFQCAVAQSGAYNRTLTPFSFQSEERTLWQAPHVYMTMSPFLAADKIKSPILLVHGQDDNNTGTFPMQSERFFSALKGHGVTTRLVLLPFEGHGYRARESLLHVLSEQCDWLDKYCRGREEEGKEAAGSEGQAKGSGAGSVQEAKEIQSRL